MVSPTSAFLWVEVKIITAVEKEAAKFVPILEKIGTPRAEKFKDELEDLGKHGTYIWSSLIRHHHSVFQKKKQ